MLASPAAAIRVRGLTHVFTRPTGEALCVLSGLDLDVEAGSHVALMGASGEGKSTLLSLLGGLDPAQAGELNVAGHNLRALGRKEMASFRSRTVGFVFQHFGLLEALTAAANIELPLSIARRPPDL